MIVLRGPGPGPAGTVIGVRWMDLQRHGQLRGSVSRDAGLAGIAPAGGALLGTSLGYVGNLWGPGTDTVEVGLGAREDRPLGLRGLSPAAAFATGSVVVTALVSVAEGPSVLSVEPRTLIVGQSAVVTVSGMRLHLAGGEFVFGAGGVGGRCVVSGLPVSTSLVQCTITPSIEARYQVFGSGVAGASVAFVDVIDLGLPVANSFSPTTGWAGMSVVINGASLGSALTTAVEIGGVACRMEASSTATALSCVVGEHPGLAAAVNVSASVSVTVNRTGVGYGVEMVSVPGTFVYVRAPTPMPPPPPPTPAQPTGGNIESDVLPSSGATSSGALALYIAGGSLIWMLLVGVFLRRKNRAKYRRDPEHWLGLGVDQYVLRSHSLIGIVTASKADVFSRGARAMSLVLSTNVLLLVTIVMLLLKPESYAEEGTVSVEKVLDMLLTTMVSMVVNAVLGVPLVKAAFQREGEGAQRLAWILSGISNAVVVVLDGVLVLVLLLVDGFELSIGGIAFVFGSGLAVSWFALEPLLIIVMYFVLGKVAVRVREGGNGGATDNVVAPYERTRGKASESESTARSGSASTGDGGDVESATSAVGSEAGLSSQAGTSEQGGNAEQ